MNMDVRLPIGLMFSVVGTLLALYGLVSNPEIYQRSLGININLIWGLVLLGFGLLMLFLAWRSARRTKDTSSISAAHNHPQR